MGHYQGNQVLGGSYYCHVQQLTMLSLVRLKTLFRITYCQIMLINCK